MTLKIFTVESAALKWFRGLDYALGHRPQIPPGQLKAERDSFGAAGGGRLRDTLLSNLLGGELNMAGTAKVASA